MLRRICITGNAIEGEMKQKEKGETVIYGIEEGDPNEGMKSDSLYRLEEHFQREPLQFGLSQDRSLYD